ncbi:DNA-binding protein [Neisseriaceae bacterium JH1-16]|nr:DNA-binding protein [Neisseriaceae bacterium JH1-16]
MKKLLSSSEIAELKLPGLPTTKVAIASRAEREGWHCEERTGLGGTRRVYEIPARYLPSEQTQESAATTAQVDSATGQGQGGNVTGPIVAGSSQVNLEMLQLVETTLEEWLQEKGLRLKPERRGAVLAVLYDYVVNKHASNEDIQRLLKVLSA